MHQFGTTVLIRAAFSPRQDEYIDACIETVEGVSVIDQLDTDDIIRTALSDKGYIWGILLSIDEDSDEAEVRLLTNHIDPKNWDRTYLCFALSELENPSVLVANSV